MMQNKQSVLWMGELDNYMNEEYIVKAFEQAGEKVTDVRVIRNKHTGLPAGYCFVDFGDGANIEAVMRRHNGNAIPNSDPLRYFKLNYASGNAPEFSLYVGDLSTEVNDIMLLDFFQQRFPSCRAARVVQEATGKSKGYGFVRFTEEQEQQRALREMEGIQGLGSRAIKIRVAVPKKNLPGGGSPTSSGHHSPPGGSSPGPAPLVHYYYPSQTPYYQLSTPSWVDPYSSGSPYMHQPYYYQGLPYQMPAAMPPDSYARQSALCDSFAFDPRAPFDVDMRNFEFLRNEERHFLELDSTQWGFITPTVPQIS